MLILVHSTLARPQDGPTIPLSDHTHFKFKQNMYNLCKKSTLRARSVCVCVCGFSITSVLVLLLLLLLLLWHGTAKFHSARIYKHNHKQTDELWGHAGSQHTWKSQLNITSDLGRKWVYLCNTLCTLYNRTTPGGSINNLPNSKFCI